MEDSPLLTQKIPMVREVDPQTQISTRNFEGKLKITSKEMLIKQIKNKQRKVANH